MSHYTFLDITSCTAYVTACDLEKSSSFDNTVEITSHVRFLIDIYSYRC